MGGYPTSVPFAFRGFEVPSGLLLSVPNMNDMQYHQSEGHGSSSRPRMLALTEMLNHNSIELPSTRPVLPAYYQQNHTAPYNPPTLYSNPRYRSQFLTTSGSQQPGLGPNSLA